MEGQTHRILIIYDPNLDYEKHKHVVQPGHQYLRGDDRIYFETQNTSVRIHIPRAEHLFTTQVPEWIPVAANGTSDTYTIKKGASGRFAYTVYCDHGDDGDFAEGGTSPAIIIKG